MNRTPQNNNCPLSPVPADYHQTFFDRWSGNFALNTVVAVRSKPRKKSFQRTKEKSDTPNGLQMIRLIENATLGDRRSRLISYVIPQQPVATQTNDQIKREHPNHQFYSRTKTSVSLYLLFVSENIHLIFEKHTHTE